MFTMTEKAVGVALKVMAEHYVNQKYLRIGVVGGGCSGFQYSMKFEDKKIPLDKEYKFKSGQKVLKVLIDSASMVFLENCEVDYVETLESSGFKFNNINVKSTCGCGSSLSI